MTPLPLLQQRETEANVIAPLFRAFAAEVGEERARQILADTIRQLAQQAGCAAGAAVGGNDLAHLKRVVERWTEGGALELTVLRDDAEAFEFNVTRCRFAEMYQRLGIAELGPLLSCNRDGALIEGFNPGIEFTRTQTIMQGATHCDFRYRHASPPVATGGLGVTSPSAAAAGR
jgi:predicted ArsR family transcriptional regulator